MKKNFTVNISNHLFQIDEDAYNMLQNYINAIHNKLRMQQGGEETVNDIEERIAEILDEIKFQGVSLINIDHVRTVISRIGSPEQLAGEDTSDTDGTYTGEEFNTNTSDQFGSRVNDQQFTGNSIADDFFAHLKGRKFYRNPYDKIIGGVMSGMAAYFGGDVTLWRVAAVVMGFVFFPIVIIAYLILALIIPANPEALQSQFGASAANTSSNETAGAQPNGNGFGGGVPTTPVKHGCLGFLIKVLFILIIVGILLGILSFFGMLFHFPFLGGWNMNWISPFHGAANVMQFVFLGGVVGAGIYWYRYNQNVKLGFKPSMSGIKKFFLILLITLMVIGFSISSIVSCCDNTGFSFNYSRNAPVISPAPAMPAFPTMPDSTDFAEPDEPAIPEPERLVITHVDKTYQVGDTVVTEGKDKDGNRLINKSFPGGYVTTSVALVKK